MSNVIRNIPFSSIIMEDTTYKISKNNIDDNLIRSIYANGLLELPVLQDTDGRYIVVFGHNRLNILSRTGIDSVTSEIIDKLDCKFFLRGVKLKNYRGEIGPIGRLKFVSILKHYFSLSADEIMSFTEDMNLPREFLNNFDIIERVLDLPEFLKDYIDSKDIGYKIIRDILRLPHEGVLIIDNWLNEIIMRVNIFRTIIDYIVDIYKRDKDLSALGDIYTDDIKDRSGKEEYLLQEIIKLRFPEYTRLKSKADDIIMNLKARNINILFPQYFEGNEIGIQIKIKKNNGIEALKDAVKDIDYGRIESLLNML